MYRGSHAVRRALCCSALAAVVFLTACETQKSRNPLSPNIVGPIPGVAITAPKPLEPANGTEVGVGQTVTLLIENAGTTGERPIWLQVDLALDAEFNSRVHSADRVTPGTNGRTSYVLPVALDGGRTYYWRARALDGANTGPYSSGSMFRVAVPLRIDTPVPLSPVRREVTPSTRAELVVGNAGFVGTPGGPVVYRFELASDLGFSQVLGVWMVPRTDGATTSVTTSDLPLNTEFYWRVNASDGGFTSAYSPIQAFRTAAPAAPPPPPAPAPTPPGPAPAPPGGGGGPWPRTGAEVVAWAERNHSDRLRAGVSGNERHHNMEFLRDRMIEAGLCGGMQLGWNLKRGGPELSVDFLTERVGGRWHGIDIAFDYDNTSRRLQLTWADTGPDNFIFHAPYSGRLPCR